MLVAALVAAPIPSKSSEISIAECRSVPLNSRCSRKCETPACAGVSSRDPVLTHIPRATERTEGTSSVTTRRPLSSSVSSTPSGQAPASPIAALALASAAPPSRPPVAPSRPPRAAAVAAVAAAAAAAAAHRRVAGAELLQLLGALAGDRRVVGEAQADPAPLLVDLGDGDVDLVALGEHVLDRVDPLAGLHVRDVQQAVGALDQLDEGAERGRLDDLGVGKWSPTSASRVIDSIRLITPSTSAPLGA